MDIDLERFNTASLETEPGMNLISSDFDLIMVNRVNERLYGKPMVELLGKKCYREFEKREEPCPHCPGRLSLITGESHVAETEGLRDDGTWFSARVRTHPVQGPGNTPTGFIEVVEDITEVKRAEKLARIDAELQTSLATSDTAQKALLRCLEAALEVEGIDAACVFSIDWSRREPTLVAQRNFSPDYVRALADSGLESAMTGEVPAHLARVPGAPRAGEIIPIAHRCQRVAVLVVGAYVYPNIPASLRAGLHGLGATAGNAISRILAERSRGDAVADLEAFITIAPLPTWLLDPEGRVTMWNRAAERLLGWRSIDVMGRRPAFGPPESFSPPDREGSHREVILLAKDGTPVPVRLTVAPFRDIVGNASASIVMAEDLSPPSRSAPDEIAGRDADTAPDEPRCQDGGPRELEAEQRDPSARLLVIDSDGARAGQVALALADSGWEAVVCTSPDEAAQAVRQAQEEERPLHAALVELIGPDGASGLEVKSSLRRQGLEAPVIVCSDAEVLGYEFHGFVAALKRPFDDESLRQAVRLALSRTR